MRRIYVTTECVNIRRAVFADHEIDRDGKLPRQCGDYEIWHRGKRETLALLKGPVSGGRGMYLWQTARKVCELMFWEINGEDDDAEG